MNNELQDLRIGDLIEVPEVQTVIDLSEIRDLDPDDPESRVTLEMLGHSFVVTNDILNILKIVLGHLDRHEGRGFFIIGNYGTGKSHLLGVLGLMARYAWARQSIFRQQTELLKFESTVNSQKLLPVLIPLTEFSGELALEQIVWHAAEIAAAMAGVPLALSSSNRYIDIFNRYVLKVHEKEFRDFVRARFDMMSWEQICREDIGAAHTIVLQFIDRTGFKIPFEVISDRKELFAELIQSLITNGWDGLLLVIDELSEFLKSKPTNRSLNEDTRFLQFLGEASSGQPVWIVAALQESLDINQDVSTAVFNKIKARYQHLKLTSKHLHQFISQRLIVRKNNDSQRLIAKVYDDLHKAFNGIHIQQKEFLTLYPVHPETLELLNHNIDLFSQRRGVVDFLSARIRGRPNAMINGILDRRCHDLLTPDVIFDHFEDRLAESPRYSSYYQLFTQQLSPKILNTFTDKDDQSIAIKAAKILILLAVTPFSEKRSVREIANMLLYRVFDSSILAGEANYAFFEERIMRVMFHNIGFLKRQPGKNRLEDVYEIDLGLDPAENIDNRLEQLKAKQSAFNEYVFKDLLSNMGHGVFPGATFLSKTSIRDSVLWQNTRRRIAVRIIDCCEIQSDVVKELRKDLKSGKIDFACLLVLPGDESDQIISIHKFLTTEPPGVDTGWAFILPVLPDSPQFEDSLLEVQACRLLIDELTVSSSEYETSTVFEILKERKEKHLSVACDYFRRAFLFGKLLLVSGTHDLSNSKQLDHFDKWLEVILRDALNLRYPEHYKVAPKSDCQSKVIQEILLDKLIRSGGSVKPIPGKDDALQAALENIALPLGLAQKKNGVYHLSGSSKKSSPAQAILEQLPIKDNVAIASQNCGVSAGRVWFNLSRAPIGMSRSVFDLTLATLIRKGFVTAFLSGKRVTIDALRLPLTGQIDHLSRGDLISESQRPAFCQLYHQVFRRHLSDIDHDSQDLLWKKMIAQFQDWMNIIDQFDRILNDWKTRSDSDLSELIETVKILSWIQKASEIFDSPLPDPILNWTQFLQMYSELASNDILFGGMKQIRAFVESGFTQLAAAKAYLGELSAKIPDHPDYSSLKNLCTEATKNAILSDSMLFEDGLKNFLTQIDTLKCLYRDYYLREHEQFHNLERNCTENLLHTHEFKVLKQLNRIPGLSKITQSQKTIDSVLTAERSPCSINPESSLDYFPVCSCGFILGTQAKEPFSTDMRRSVMEQIKLCFFLLKNAVNDLSYENSNQSNLSDKHKRFQKLVGLDVESPSFLLSLESLFDDEMIDFISQMDFVKNVHLSMSCSELLLNLQGRVMTISQVRETICRLLQQLDGLNENDRICFTE